VRCRLRKEKQGERPRDEWIIYCKGRMSVISALSWKGSISPKNKIQKFKKSIASWISSIVKKKKKRKKNSIASWINCE
jgi:fatty acid-binding protein DegV